MIFLKSDEEIELLRISNQIIAKTLGELAKIIAPGVTTAYLDKIANAFIKWRYEYESLKMQINTGFLIVLSDIFKNECYDKLLEGEEQIIKEYEQKKI